MSRKMQTKAQTQPLLSTEILNLMMTGAALALIVATAIVFLFVAPANAETPRPAAEQLTVWADELPANFQTLAAGAGLDVMDIERLVSLDAHIVVVQSVDNHSPERLLEMLGATFPTMAFESMNNTADDFELAGF